MWKVNQEQFSVVDYIVFGGMMTFSTLIGLYHRNANKRRFSANGVLIGRGKMSYLPVSLSLLASFLSSVTLIGQPTEVYLYGSQIWLLGISSFLALPLVGYVMIPFFRKHNYFSVYKYIGDRYSRSLELVISINFTLQMILYSSIVLYAPALAVNQVTDLSITAIVTVTFAVCVFYTSFGGIQAVVWSDAFQILFLFCSMVILVIKGVLQAGGLTSVYETSLRSGRIAFFNLDPDPTTRFTVWSTLVGGAVLFCGSYGANQMQVQRYLAVSSNAEARKMLWINSVGWSIIVVLTTLIGLVVYATYEGCDPISTKQISKPDQILALFVMETLAEYPGYPGLFFSSLFAAGLSTLSTGCNSLAAVWYSELSNVPWKYLDKVKPATQIKILSIIFGIASYFLVFLIPYMGNLVQVAITTTNIANSSVLCIFLMGIYFPSFNAKGAFMGLISSFVAVMWLLVGGISTSLSIHPSLPFQNNNCSDSIGTSNATAFPSLSSKEDDVWSVYRISFLWYGTVAWLITFIVGTITSTLFPDKSLKESISQMNEPLT